MEKDIQPMNKQAAMHVLRPALGALPKRRANTDTVKLLMLGYRQELSREFTLFNSFGSSFVALNPMTGLAGAYGLGVGYTYGGPVAMMWGRLVVMLFSTSMGLSIAELASAYPTSGALYYWSHKLAPPRLRNLACWMTAWILTLGQVAFSASVFYTFVQLVQAAVAQQYGLSFNELQRLGVLVLLLLVVGLFNCGSARMTAFLTTVGTLWCIIGLVAFSVAVFFEAQERQSAKYVFTSWEPSHDVTGITSPVYTVLIGLLMSQWNFTGFDGSAHLSEETLNAEVNVPYGILFAILGSGASGYLFMLALTFVRMDENIRFDPRADMPGADVVLQILTRLSRGLHAHASSAVALFTVPIVAAFFCSVQSIANNSRMMYAFARDDGVPLSKYAKLVVARTQTPVYGMLYMLVASGALAVPMCFNAYMFPVVASFAVLACYAAYMLPVLCKLSTGSRQYLPGPFYLGPRLSYINNLVSVSWALLVMAMATLPTFYPVTAANCNWSGPSLAGVMVLLLGWYFMPKHGARHWFTGPRANLGQFQDVLPSEIARRAEQARPAERTTSVAAVPTVSSSDGKEAEAVGLGRVVEEVFSSGPSGSAVVRCGTPASAKWSGGMYEMDTGAGRAGGCRDTDSEDSSSGGDGGSNSDSVSQQGKHVSALCLLSAGVPGGEAATALASKAAAAAAADSILATGAAAAAACAVSTEGGGRRQPAASGTSHDHPHRRHPSSPGQGRSAGVRRLPSGAVEDGDRCPDATAHRRSRSSSRRSLANSGTLITTAAECAPDPFPPSSNITELMRQLHSLTAAVASQGGRRVGAGDGRKGPGGGANPTGYLLPSAGLLSTATPRPARDRSLSLRRLSYNRLQSASGPLGSPRATGADGPFGAGGTGGAGEARLSREARASRARRGSTLRAYGRGVTAGGLQLCVPPGGEAAAATEGVGQVGDVPALGSPLLALAHTHTAQRWRTGLAAVTGGGTAACLLATADDVRQLFPADRRSVGLPSATDVDDIFSAMLLSSQARNTLGNTETDAEVTSQCLGLPQQDPDQPHPQGYRSSARAALRGSVSVLVHASNTSPAPQVAGARAHPARDPSGPEAF